MGEMADYDFDMQIDSCRQRDDFELGLVSLHEAYDSGLVDELGFQPSDSISDAAPMSLRTVNKELAFSDLTILPTPKVDVDREAMHDQAVQYFTEAGAFDKELCEMVNLERKLKEAV